MIDRIRSTFHDVDDSDLFLAIGSLSLFFGVYLIYPPAAYIAVSLIFLFLAYIIANPKLSHTVAE